MVVTKKIVLVTYVDSAEGVQRMGKTWHFVRMLSEASHLDSPL